jgi:hypothetical protein
MTGDCGFESIFLALSCKKSALLERYKINDLDDLKNLLIHGKDGNQSLHDTFRTHPFLGLSDCHAKAEERGISVQKEWEKELDHFQHVMIYEEGVTMWFFAMVSLYFNIHIVLNGDCEPSLVELINRQIRNPSHIITLEREPGHVAYQPLDDEKTTYDKIADENKRQNEIRRSEETLREMMFMEDLEMDDEDDVLEEYFRLYSQHIINGMPEATGASRVDDKICEPFVPIVGTITGASRES